MTGHHLSMNVNIHAKHECKHSCLDDAQSWDELINKLLFTYNNTARSSTKFSPYDLVYTYQVNDLHSRIESPTVNNVNIEEFVVNSRLDSEDDRHQAHSNAVNSQLANKARLDIKSKPRVLKIGDRVLMKSIPNKRSKMSLRWHGPYLVVGCSSDKNYQIEINGEVRSYHIDLLKVYNDPSDASNEPSDSNAMNESMINSISYMPIFDSAKRIEVIKPCDDISLQAEMDSLMSTYNELFTPNTGTTNVVCHSIKLKDDTPVKKSAYSVPLAYRDRFKAELDKMLKEGIIEPSNSDYASPCIIMPRKDQEEIRIAVDYRSLNDKLVKDREPVSRTQSIFGRIPKGKYYSVIDLKNGFYQIPLDEESRKYTAFITEFGLFQFKVLPFGIANGPAEFSRLMRGLFPDHPNIFTFLDDILIATETASEHFKCLQHVFETLKSAKLKINIKKSHFFAEKIDFLGQTLSIDYVSPQSEKIQAILDFPLPDTKKKLQSFLGLSNYYRNYISEFATLTFHLYNMVKKNSPNKLVWNNELIECFDNLKISLSRDIKLYHINPSLPFIVQTDASSQAIGAIIGQRTEPNGPVLPIQCISKKLNDTQMRYSTLEREAFAIVWAIEKFSFYLLGQHFIIETDHQPLTYINKYSKSKDKLRRWELILSNYDYEIKHIEGKKNIVSDCLSRLV